MTMLKEKNVVTVLESLMNPMSWKIGIYGIGGSGKTSTLKAIFHDLKITGNFETLIWVKISRNFNLRRVQDQIAQKLDLHLSIYEYDRKRAAQLSQRLRKSIKAVLIILDDVWDPVPLEEVGIPNPNESNKLKLVVATRFLDVCHHMETQKNIRIELLSEEETSNIFYQNIGNLFWTPELQLLAAELIRECGGLPLAIEAVQRSMKKKVDIKLWRKLLMDLRSSPTKVRGMEAVFEILRSSYRRLNNDTSRKCFLHLAFFPKDYRIEADELISCWMAEFINEGYLETKIDEARKILNELLDVSFLEKCSELDNNSIRMHKFTRGLAIHILEEEGDILIKAGLGLTEVPKSLEWRKSRKISLMKNMIEVLPSFPIFPNLSTLLLRENPLSQIISSPFFSQMPALEILDLSHTRISELPSSISELFNLQALFLQECTSLEKIPSLAKLKKLRMLNLSRAGIKELPQGMEELISLSSLDLSYTLELEMDFLTVDKEGKLSSTRNQIDVICDQPNWSNVQYFSLRGNHILQRISCSFFSHMPALEILDLSKTSISELPSSVSDLLNLRALCLEECTYLEKIPSLANLGKLQKLNLSHSAIQTLPEGMEKLIGLKSVDLSFTSHLESCDISKLTFLEELRMEGSKIWIMDSISVSKYIEVLGRLDRLVILTLSFVKLKDYHKAFMCLQWERLRNFSVWISDTLNLFINCYTESSPKMVYIQNQNISSYSPNTLILPPNTQELRLSLCDISRLSEIFCLRDLRFLNACQIERCSLVSGDCLIWGNEMKEETLASLQALSLENVKGLTVLWKSVVSSPFLTNLRVLEVHSCGSLKSLFCFNLLYHLKKIEVIKVTLCVLLEEIISDVQDPHDLDNRITPWILLPRLHTLILKDLPKLCSISRIKWVCVSLRHVKVFRCLELKRLPFDVDNLPKLEEIQGEKAWWEALKWDNAVNESLLQSRFQHTEQNC